MMRSMIFVLMLWLAGCMTAGYHLREGIQSFKAQDYRQAFIHLKPEADKGHPDAQYAVGYMYYYGQGVIEDRAQAWYWITRAAKSGQKDAVSAVKLLRRSKR